MSMDEPKAMGTVVLARLANADMDSPIPWVLTPGGVWVARYQAPAAWRQLLDPVIVHEGYTPPTPEPMYHGARIIDADDLRLVRKWSDAVDEDPYGEPWTSARGISYAWSELTQPVTVIDDGSDW